MSLLGYQRALSRILTDSSFRTQFQTGDREAQSRYDLTERELDSLIGIRSDRVRVHSHLLAHGRVELGFMAFPLTYGLIGRAVSDLTDEFCAAHPPRPEARGALLVEADRVFAFFHPRLESGEIGPPWVADLMAVEHVQVQLGSSVAAWRSSVEASASGDEIGDPRTAVPFCGDHVRTVRLKYPVFGVMSDLEDGTRIDDLPLLPEPAETVMFKTSGTPWVRSCRVNEPTAELIRSCDGTRSITQVLDVLRKTYGPGVEGPALQALDRLRAAGVLGLRRSVQST
jgi:hypothetical protein